MGCGVYWQQIKELDRALSTLRKYKIPELSDAYQILSNVRIDLLGKMGIKIPRTITQVIRLFGFSPGSIALWHDVEEGWLTEARREPTSLPVYKIVSDDIAMAVLQRQITDELEEYLLTPDPHLGN